MASQPETDKPLILLRKSEITMAEMAVNEVYGQGNAITQNLLDTVKELDWPDQEVTVEYHGEERDLVLHALYECAVAQPEKIEAPTEYQQWLQEQREHPWEPMSDVGWKQAQAAVILGNHFASIMAEPTFTPAVIAQGLIKHDPGIDGPISASIPVLIDA